MKVENWKIDKVKPYPGNPRILGNAVEAVAKSLRDFGFRQPLVVDGDGVLIVGHARLEAAKLIGLKEVPVHVATELTEEQVRAYRLADNKSGELAQWDDEKLLAELRELGGDLEMSGFSDAELLALEMEVKSMFAAIEAEHETERNPPARDLPQLNDEPANDHDDPAEDPSGGESSDDEDEDASTAGVQMLPFSVVLEESQRAKIYEAINKAKAKHGIEQSGEALFAICKEWADAAL